jgi:hypothetical protein
MAGSTQDPVAIQHNAYEALAGTHEYESLNKGDAARVDSYDNPYHFAELLPLYSVKVIFVAAILCLHKLGVSWVQTGHMISGMSYAAMGMLVAFWLGKYVNGYKSTFVWLCIMTVPTVGKTACLFTPDALSCGLAASAAWLILERQRYWWGMSVALLTVWVRPDYLLFIGILAVALWWIRKVSLVEAGIVIALALGSYALIASYSGSYGLPFSFRSNFMG